MRGVLFHPEFFGQEPVVLTIRSGSTCCFQLFPVLDQNFFCRSALVTESPSTREGPGNSAIIFRAVIVPATVFFTQPEEQQFCAPFLIKKPEK